MTSAHTSDCETKQTRSQNLRLREGGAGCWVGRRQVAHTCQGEDFTEEGPSGPLGWKGILQTEEVEGLRMQQSACPLCLSAQAQAPSLVAMLQDPPSSSKFQSRQSTLRPPSQAALEVLVYPRSPSTVTHTTLHL